MSKYIDLIALNRVLTNIRTELEKGTNTKYGITTTVEASNKLAPGANIKVVDSTGKVTSKLFDGTKDIAITATEIGANTKAEDTAAVATKVDKVDGKKLSTEDYSNADKVKLTNIEANANNYTHPEKHLATEVVTNENKRFVSDADKTNWSNKYTRVETDSKISTALESIIWKAAVATFADIATTYPEPKDGWVVNVNDTDITYRYTGKEWIAISANAIPLATKTVDGKISKSDKAKIDGVEAGANLYTHPESHPAAIVVESPTHRFVTDALKTSYADKHTVSEFNDKAGTKVDIANCATPEEVDNLFLGLFPRPPKGSPLRFYVRPQGSAPVRKAERTTGPEKLNIDLSKCLKSWGEVSIGGVKYNDGIIPGTVDGVLLVEDAVLLDAYDYSNNFYEAFRVTMNGMDSSVLIEISGKADATSCTSMQSAFNSAYALMSADLSEWRFNALTSMELIFNNCYALYTLNLTGWDTSKVTNMVQAFSEADCRDIIGLDTLNFDSVVDAYGMFTGVQMSSLKLPNMNMPNVKNAADMFIYTSLIDIELVNFNPTSITKIDGFVSGSSQLATLKIPKLTFNSGTNSAGMFDGCDELTDLDISGVDTDFNTVVKFASEVQKSSATQVNVKVSSHDKHAGIKMSKVVFDCGGCPPEPTTLNIEINGTAPAIDLTKCLKSHGVVKFNGEVVDSIPASTAGTIEIADAVALDGYNLENNFGTAIPSLVKFSGKIDTSSTVSMYAMFGACMNAIEIDCSMFDTSSAISMSYMFAQCQKLSKLNVLSFNTSGVTNMGQMFAACMALQELNVSTFDTSNVTDMQFMFAYHPGTTLDVSMFNTSKVTNMSQMFAGCSNLEVLDLSNFDVGRVTACTSMFQSSSKLRVLNIRNFGISYACKNKEMMFAMTDALSEVYINGYPIRLNDIRMISEEISQHNDRPTTVYASAEEYYAGLNFPNVTYAVKSPR